MSEVNATILCGKCEVAVQLSDAQVICPKCGRTDTHSSAVEEAKKYALHELSGRATDMLTKGLKLPKKSTGMIDLEFTLEVKRDPAKEFRFIVDRLPEI